MPTQQQIALSLVAQLDRGNVEAEAQQMASSMTQAIEKAFEGLGDKIAQTILKGGMAGLSELSKNISGTSGGLTPLAGAAVSTETNSSSENQQVNALKERLQSISSQLEEQKKGAIESVVSAKPSDIGVRSPIEPEKAKEAVSQIEEQKKQSIEGIVTPSEVKKSMVEERQKTEVEVKPEVKEAIQQIAQQKPLVEPQATPEIKEQQGIEKSVPVEVKALDIQAPTQNIQQEINDLKEQIAKLSAQKITPVTTTPATAIAATKVGDNSEALKQEINTLKEQLQKVMGQLETTKGAQTQAASPVTGAPAPQKPFGVQLGGDVGVAVQQARAMNAVEDAGLKATLTPEQSELFDKAKKVIDESLAKELEALNQNIKDLKDETKDQTDVQRESRRIAETTTTLAGAKNQIESVTEPKMDLMGMMKMLGGVAGLTAMTTELIRLPTTSIQREAAQAEVANSSGRALMRGDLDKTVAIGRLGGTEELAKSTENQAMGEGLAKTVAAAVTGGLVAGPIGALVGGLGTAAYSILQMPQQQQSIQEQRIAGEQGRSAEFLQFSKAGRNQAMQAFGASRQAGGTELSEFLMGREALTKGADMGLRPEEVNRTLQTLTGAGGVVQGQTPYLQQLNPQVNDLLGLQAQGINGAPEAAVAFAKSGQQSKEGFKEAFESVKDIAIEMVASGMDKTAASRSMQFMAQQASQGLGAASPARAEAERATTVAQSMFGNAGQQQMDFTQRGLHNVLRGTEGGQGLLATAGFSAARGTQQEIKKRLGVNIDEMTLQSSEGGVSEGGLRALLEQQGGMEKGGKASPEQEKAMKEIVANDQQRRLQATKQVLNAFGPQGQRIASAQATGAKTFEERVRAPDLIREGANLNMMQGDRMKGPVQFDPTKAPGGAETQIIAKEQALEITTGFQTLGSNLKMINEAFKDLISKAKTVLSDEEHRTTPKVSNNPFKSSGLMGNPMGAPIDMSANLFSGK